MLRVGIGRNGSIAKVPFELLSASAAVGEAHRTFRVAAHSLKTEISLGRAALGMVDLQIGRIAAVAERVKGHQHYVIGAQAVQTNDRIGIGRCLAVPKVPEVANGIAAVDLEFNADGISDRIGKEGGVE